jgi:TIR domain
MGEVESQNQSEKTLGPLIFISHDTRDADLAEAFSQLLRSVSAGVLKSFRSSDKRGNQGIEYGVEWYPEIIKNIQSASDVVCLLTAKSIDRPWILFEAGMAKGKLETPILGVALGIQLRNASTGPFAQFQNCGDDEESLCKLVSQLVKRIPNSEPDVETIKFQVGNFKKNINDIFDKQNSDVYKTSNEETEKEDSSAKLFEEIKVMFQDLPSRIEQNMEDLPRQIKSKRKFYPKNFKEINLSKRPLFGVMAILSMFKDSSTPWIYDLGIDVVRLLRSEDSLPKKEHKLEEFCEFLEFSTQHPMIRDTYMDSKEDYIFYREAYKFLEKGLNQLIREERQRLDPLDESWPPRDPVS